MTYILTAEKAKLSAVDKAKNLYHLTVPLAAAVPTMPYIINSHPGGLQQGVLSTARFMRDWAALCDVADYREGHYAIPNFASDVQCAKENFLDAAMAIASPATSNLMLVVHGSPRAIVADIYNVAVAKGVATFSLRWIKAPKDTPDFCRVPQEAGRAGRALPPAAHRRLRARDRRTSCSRALHCARSRAARRSSSRRECTDCSFFCLKSSRHTASGC